MRADIGVGVEAEAEGGGPWWWRGATGGLLLNLLLDLYKLNISTPPPLVFIFAGLVGFERAFELLLYIPTPPPLVVIFAGLVGFENAFELLGNREG